LLCAFHFISFNVDAAHAPTNHKWYDPLHIITWPYWFIDLDFTFFGPSASSHHSTCPSHLQPVHQIKSCLDLLHLSDMTQCHVSYAMSSFINICVSFATSPSYFTSMASMAQTHVPVTNHLCISL
jgi:hypothetical protein